MDQMDASVRPYSFKAWMACVRPKTWGIAIAPVAVGLSYALAEQGSINCIVAIATVMLSILMQAISNMENDAGYTKRKAERGNRKGLPRATAKGWLSVQSVELAIKLLGLVVILDTLFLIYVGGIVMALISLCSIVAAYCYMGGPKPIAYTPFGEFVVFIFFGLVAVCGTYYLQTGTVSFGVSLLAAAVGCIAAAVLAVNNYRDLEHDASIGRSTLAVVLGTRNMARCYNGLLFLPFALVAALICHDSAFAPLGITIFSIPLSIKLTKQLPNKQGLELNQVMFGTIQLELLYSLLLTIGSVITFLMSL